MLGISNCQPNDGNQSRKEASFSSVGNADIFHLTSGSGRGSGRGPLRRRAYVDAYSPLNAFFENAFFENAFFDINFFENFANFWLARSRLYQNEILQ